MMPRESAEPVPSTVALLPWGDVIEDFLDGIGVSFDEFSSRMTGGWLFGYVDALRLHGMRTAIVCFSRRFTVTTRSIHTPTGASLIVLPAPAAYRAIRRHMRNPYGCSVDAMFGATSGWRHGCRRAVQNVAPYLATPVTALAREIRRAGCSAILCQEYEAPRFDAAIVVGRLLRLPVYATFQGGTWARCGLERRLRPHTLRSCAGLIIGSSTEIERVRTQYSVPAGKIARIFNPLDLAAWPRVSRREARREMGIPDTARVAVWHGRIDIHRKGLDILLEAWRRNCAARPGQEDLLVLIGDGSDADTFARAIASVPPDRIRWIREYVLDKARICRYVRAADVYVLPSRHEGFPVAPLEAMACGLPVVAAAAPGVSDIFEEGEASGGVIVPTGDPAALADAVRRLLDDGALRRCLGLRARARIEQAFDAHVVGAQLRRFVKGRAGLAPELSPGDQIDMAPR